MDTAYVPTTHKCVQIDLYIKDTSLLRTLMLVPKCLLNRGSTVITSHFDLETELFYQSILSSTFRISQGLIFLPRHCPLRDLSVIPVLASL